MSSKASLPNAIYSDIRKSLATKTEDMFPPVLQPGEERMRQRKQHARNLRVASISSLRRLRILAYAGRTRRGHERQRLLSPTVHYKELVCILNSVQPYPRRLSP